ncbi:hypothetical protein HGRIS_003635 [Hohenbuehelia grisea]|uniref:DUF5648 domain-containing protein n=1 Tax=Hohenbuehelia grisea TaxID=104357 RepID=A0ABR3JHS1_9AGAR
MKVTLFATVILATILASAANVKEAREPMPVRGCPDKKQTIILARGISGGRDHFYATDFSEFSDPVVVRDTSRDAGRVFPSDATDFINTTPLNRYYSSEVDDHYYSTTRTDATISIHGTTYDLEGPEAYVLTDLGYQSCIKAGVNVKPFIRFYSSAKKDHLYSTDRNEGRLAGYEWEGVSGYIFA